MTRFSIRSDSPLPSAAAAPAEPGEDRWLQGYWFVAGFVPWFHLPVPLSREKVQSWLQFGQRPLRALQQDHP
jgi:hypothetical protein